MRIISGMFWRPMRCPRRNNIMLERVNGCCGNIWGDCDCGYSYDDMVEGRPAKHVQILADEFYFAPRTKDEEEAAAWWEEWRNAHPEMDDPRQTDRDWQAYLDGPSPAKYISEMVDKSPPS